MNTSDFIVLIYLDQIKGKGVINLDSRECSTLFIVDYV